MKQIRVIAAKANGEKFGVRAASVIEAVAALGGRMVYERSPRHGRHGRGVVARPTGERIEIEWVAM